MPYNVITDNDRHTPVGVVTTPRWNVVEVRWLPTNYRRVKYRRTKSWNSSRCNYILRNNNYLFKKKLGDGIVSFNFTREAFLKVTGIDRPF